MGEQLTLKRRYVNMEAGGLEQGQTVLEPRSERPRDRHICTQCNCRKSGSLEKPRRSPAEAEARAVGAERGTCRLGGHSSPTVS